LLAFPGSLLAYLLQGIFVV